MAIKLKDISLFEGIDNEYVSMIIDNSRRIERKAGETIIYQGAESNGAAYIIQEGILKVFIDGNEIKRIGEGELFGEMALITDEPRTAEIIAETDVILLQIDKELLHTIIKKFKNGKDIQEVFMKRILENIKR